MDILERIKRGAATVISALLCVVLGLVIGFAVLLLLSYISYSTGDAPFTFKNVIERAYDEGFIRLMKGCFYMLNGPLRGMQGAVKTEILQASTLIMTGLSVGFAFKAGLFNIGAAGQYTVGAFGALFSAIVLKFPWYLSLLSAMLLGALWGAIPGLFKAFLNINEVITSIMFNWIGLYAVNTIIYSGGTGVMYNVKLTKTQPLSGDAVIPNMSIFVKKAGNGQYLQKATIAIFIAIAIAVILYFVINMTTFGYEIKACGHSRTAARYAGINEKKNIILSMAIAGGLAGIGAGLYYLTDGYGWNPQASTALPSLGFDGISVALLASSNPIGTILSALFIAHINFGGAKMNAAYFPTEVAGIVSGVIIYLCAFMLLFKRDISKGLDAIFTRKAKGGKNHVQ